VEVIELDVTSSASSTGAIDPVALFLLCTIHEGDGKERHRMGQVKGDKARYNRERRKKIARRAEMRALRATLGAAGTATPQPKAGAATKG
jgi:hypothetical protein